MGFYVRRKKCECGSLSINPKSNKQLKSRLRPIYYLVATKRTKMNRCWCMTNKFSSWVQHENTKKIENSQSQAR